MRSWVFIAIASIASACRCQLTAKGTDYYCLPETCTDAGDLVLSKSNATKVHLTKVASGQTIKIQDNPKLTFLDISALGYIKELTLTGNPLLEGVRADALAGVGVANLDGLSINYPKLERADELNIVNSHAHSVSLPHLNYSKALTVSGNAAIGRLEFPELTRATQVAITGNANLTQIQFGSGVQNIVATIDSNPALVHVYLDKSNGTSAKLTITNNNNLADIYLDSVERSDAIAIANNTNLRLVRLPRLARADSVHISDLITNSTAGKAGCVFMSCFFTVQDFDVFKCGKQENIAPMCSKKEQWSCDCKFNN